jgi:hypothetical protein
MNSLSITFDSSDFVFDATKVEINSGAIRLKDLGAGSYSTQNPSVRFKGFLQLAALTSLAFNSVVGEVRYVFIKNGSLLYYSNGAWVSSDGTFAKSNLWSEISSAVLTLYETGDYFSFLAFLHSDGTVQTEIGSVSIEYQAASVLTVPSLTQVFGYVKDMGLGALADEDIVIKVDLFAPGPAAGSYTILQVASKIVPVVDGYFEVYLINTETLGLGQYYAFTINGVVYKRKVADVAAENWNELELAF